MKPVRPGDLTPAKPPEARMTRRSLLLGGTGIAALSVGGLAAYSGAEAATALLVTRYKLSPRGWPAGRRLSITVLADIHAGGPNMASNGSAMSSIPPTRCSPTSSFCSAISSRPIVL